MTDDSKATPRPSKEQAHLRYYNAFHDWFMQSSCDFWSECDAPEYLAQIAVDLEDGAHDALVAERDALKAEIDNLLAKECAACGGPYPNENCGHLKNARDLGHQAPCVPVRPDDGKMTPPPMKPSAEDRATARHCFACFGDPPSSWLVDDLRKAYHDGYAAAVNAHDALVAERDRLRQALEEARDALEITRNVLAMTKFEPDAGEPHPMPDYAYDRAIQQSYDALTRIREALGDD